MIKEPTEPPLDCSDEELQAYRKEWAAYDAELTAEHKREMRKLFLMLPLIFFVLIPIGSIFWGIAWLKEKLFGIPMNPDKEKS
jgi:hypothetical protein